MFELPAGSPSLTPPATPLVPLRPHDEGPIARPDSLLTGLKAAAKFDDEEEKEKDDLDSEEFDDEEDEDLEEEFDDDLDDDDLDEEELDDEEFEDDEDEDEIEEL